MVYTDGRAYYSKPYYMDILDYIGAGDAYCEGLIYAYIQNYEPQKMVEFANAASCLKHTFSESGNEVQR